MGKLAARKGDEHNCPKEQPKKHGTGLIIEGSPNVTIGGMPAARVGDKIQCEDGSTTSIEDNGACLIINGKKAARIGDKSSHGGEITSGAGSVFIADGAAFIEFGDEGVIEIGENVYFGDELSSPEDTDTVLESPVGNAKITSKFDAIRTCQPCSTKHLGTDYAVPIGTNVVATADGKVSRAYRSETYGNVVIIDHGPAASGNGNVYTLYAHGKSIPVKQRQIISKGESVLISGHTGNSTRPHLHYEIIKSTKKPMEAGFFDRRNPRFGPKDLKNLIK